MSMRDVVIVGRRAISEARDDRVTTTAQALAYALFLTIPAAMLVALGVFSLVADADDIRSMVDRFGQVMPPEATSLVQESLQRAIDTPGRGIAMTVVGVALALWSITSAATTLMEGLTTAFDRRDERSFVRKRALALLLAMCLVLSAAAVIGFLVLGSHVERWIGDAIAAPSLTTWVWWTAQWPILIGLLFFAFVVLLSVGPDVEQKRWRLVAPGAVVALAVWLLGSGGFALYTSHFGSYDKTWGTLAAVVVTLVWLWLTSAALLLGAEVNAEAQRYAAERHRVTAGVAESRAPGQSAGSSAATVDSWPTGARSD